MCFVHMDRWPVHRSKSDAAAVSNPAPLGRVLHDAASLLIRKNNRLRVLNLFVFGSNERDRKQPRDNRGRCAHKRSSAECRNKGGQ